MTLSFVSPALTPERQRNIQRHLSAGEAVLWSGSSSLLRQVQRNGMSIFGSAFFALIGLMIAIGGAVNGTWLVWIGIAIFLAAGWSIVRGWRLSAAACKSVYLVTNQRVSILSSDGAAQSLTREEASGRLIKAGLNGMGDLYFTVWEKQIESSEGGSVQRSGFLGIPDVKSVDELIGRTFGEYTPVR